MDPTAGDDGALLGRAARGERAAFEELFARHRPRLTRAVALRLDRRLAARVDASDVVQEACLEAFRRLPDYLRQPDLPLDVWLLWLAREQVLMAHRKHLIALSEKAWITYEKRDCAYAGSAAQGGTLAPILQGECLVDRTRTRIADLKEFAIPLGR